LFIIPPPASAGPGGPAHPVTLHRENRERERERRYRTSNTHNIMYFLGDVTPSLEEIREEQSKSVNSKKNLAPVCR